MRPALLVIDMQYDFKKDGSIYSAQMLDAGLVERTRQLIELCRGRKAPIIYTQHTIKPDKSNTEFGEPAEVRLCIEGTRGWEIFDELKPLPRDDVVRKDKYDAFLGTDLEEILRRKRGADTVLVSGVLTNNCVRATTEGAHYRGFRKVLVSDCMGATSYDPRFSHEQIHDITLQDLFRRLYEVQLTTLEELQRDFDSIANRFKTDLIDFSKKP